MIMPLSNFAQRHANVTGTTNIYGLLREHSLHERRHELKTGLNSKTFWRLVQIIYGFPFVCSLRKSIIAHYRFGKSELRAFSAWRCWLLSRLNDSNFEMVSHLKCKHTTYVHLRTTILFVIVHYNYTTKRFPCLAEWQKSFIFTSIFR
jgi:hypothetical protein